MKFGRLQNGLIKAQPETAPSNFISNPTPLKDTTGYSLYSDAAGIAPVDGTGGSVNTGTEINWSRTTSSPLSETASFLFSKIATSSMQGKGVSYDFTVNHGDKSKVCRIDFDYEVASGTYADGDLTVWLYDITNGGAPIQPSASSILNAIGPQKKQPLSFQTNSNSTSYRLIIHVASTSASAYTVKFDNVSVVRESISQGTVGIDWTAYVPVFTGLGTVTISEAFWKRDGDSMFIRGRATLGTTTGATATLSLPGTATIDSSKATITTIYGTLQNHSATKDFQVLATGGNTTVSFSDSSSSGLASVIGTAVGSSGQAFGWTAGPIPIQGWSSSQQLSSDADTRVVAARYSTSAGQSIPNNAETIVDFGTMFFDTHGAVTTGASWKYTAKVPGKYKVASFLYFSSGGGWSAGEEAQLIVYKNGVFYTYLYVYASSTTHTSRVALNGSTTIDLVGGDYIDVRIYQGSGGAITLLNSGNTNYVDIERISGPAQIAASEVIAFSGKHATGGSIGTTVTTINYASEAIDTHGAYSGGVFTVPAPGIYKVSAALQFASASWTLASIYDLRVMIDGSSQIIMQGQIARTATQEVPGLTLSHLFRLNAGQTIQIAAYQNETAGGRSLGSAAYNYASIERIGGVG